MKRTFFIAFAAFALLSFTCCQKENLVSENQEPALRIVTAVFENDGTKTTLGTNDIPLWDEGDKICILASNDSVVIELQESNITENGRKVTFTLTKELSGTLYAVYPASATTMTSCSGSIDFTIPELQDGTFGSANICVAKGDSKDNLVFSNASSVLEFSQTASSTSVLRVAVTAANAIAGKCTATFGDDNKATISTNELTGKLIWTSASTTAQDKYYVAIAPGVTGDVNFKYYTNLKEASENKTTKTLAQNKIYGLTIPTAGYEDSYVTIGGKKWAKTNIGATNPQDYGRYFQWGEIAGHECNGTINGSTYNYNFNWASAPFNNGQSNYDGTYFTNKKSTWLNSDDVLKSDYDAAYQTWGSSWRMPTKQDFTDLANDCRTEGYSSDYFSPTETKESFEAVDTKGVYWITNYNSGDNITGLVFYNGTNKLFFPAAGYGDGTGLSGAGSYGYYWSSTLYPSYPNLAYDLYFHSGEVGPQARDDRYYGFSVRPVSD